MSLSDPVDDLELVPEHRRFGRLAGVAGRSRRLVRSRAADAPEAPA